MVHLSTDFSVPRDQITFWFSTQGRKFGLRYDEGKESIVNHIGQAQTCMSSVFIDQIRAAKEMLK